MRIAVGADHAGFELKQALLDVVIEVGHETIDMGTHSLDPVDYPDIAALVGRAVQNGDADRGLLVCGSGAGASIAANKLNGIRAAQASDTYTAHQCVEHDDANVLVVGGRIIGVEVAREIVIAFLGAQFTGEPRHLRRLEKVNKLEQNSQPNTALD